MKLTSKITIGLATAALLIIGCSAPSIVKPTISEESLGLRKSNLYAEAEATHGDATKYSKSTPGSGYKIQRAFQDAPPMIPHDVEGMIPITIDNNQCVSCHMPEVASSVGATAIPVSHLTNFRPATAITKDGKLMNNGEVVDPAASTKSNAISIKSNGDKLTGARFNCTQCHAPQSEGLAVESNFKPVYTSKDGASKSNWNGSKMTEGLDTIHGK
jgi:cytochrome c-type protein NapB